MRTAIDRSTGIGFIIHQPFPHHRLRDLEVVRLRGEEADVGKVQTLRPSSISQTLLYVGVVEVQIAACGVFFCPGLPAPPDAGAVLSSSSSSSPSNGISSSSTP